MKTLKFLFRLIYICFVLAKYGLDKLLVSFSVFSAFRFIVYLNPWNWRAKKKHTPGEALTLALEQLGPIFIKFGQALSTRKDLLSAEFTGPLSRLQDNVQPFSAKKTLDIMSQAFGEDAHSVFKHFDETPLASASMAQVHCATLKSDHKVVVKILRPNIRNKITRDLNVMWCLAYLLERYCQGSKRLKPKEIVEEFSSTLFDELDLMREAGNASQLRRNFKDSPLLYVPEIHWHYARDNVLVMERIHGIPISNIKALNEKQINLKVLAERGIEIFFTQVFKDCFFHADMHPGNIFVNPESADEPQYICVDFGIMGTLTDKDKRYLAENLLAFFNRDYRKVAILHIESGWVPATTRPDAFESAIRTVCEPIFERPLKDISFGQVILRLFQTGRRFNMEVQPQLILLQKTLLAIEGLGRQLYPELNLWSTAKPFLENWLKEQIGLQALLKNTKDNIPFITEQLPHLPKMMFDVFQQQKAINQQQLEQTNAPKAPENAFKKGMGLALLLLPAAAVIMSKLIPGSQTESVALLVGIVGAYLYLS
tara:strand:- start:580 stop:2199 length:1620 start_codon:yes stop_codon:yes gene_type:complete